MAEVYVEGKLLDVFEGFKFSFNYSIADIRHPEKRTTTYSKTIQCPGTQNNDEIFGQIYDFNISNSYDSSTPNIEVNFNPNKKASASVQADGVEVMRGSLQLRKIKRKKSDYIYEVVFVGKLINIFGVLGDKQLSGVDSQGLRYIDFSDLDHTYNRPTQEASWTAPYGVGYMYPMIDYGFNVRYAPIGWRYYWVTDLKPAVYVKDIIDRIFAFTGFTYTSTIFSSAFFARLIVPFSNLYLKESVAEARKFKAVKTIDQLVHRLDNPPFSNSFGNEQYFTNWGEMAKVCFEDDSILGFDNGNNYQIYPFQYNYNAVDNYVFFSQVTRADNFTVGLDLQIRKNHALSRAEYHGFAQLVYENPSSGIMVLAETPWSWNLDLLNVGDIASQSIYIEGTSLDSPYLKTFHGDQVYVRLMSPAHNEDGTISLTGFAPDFRNTTGATGDEGHWLDFRITGGYLQNEPVREGVYEHNPIDMNLATPEVGMADFLVSLINMFNLYVLPDPENDNNLLIETRDDFYEAGSEKDWTHKVDYSKEVTLEPLALLTANEYEYTYTEDGDYYNERYQDSYSHAYGRARIDVDNDFLNNTNTTRIVFSPTPLVNDGPSNRLVSKIYDSDVEEGAQPTDHNIRILYYGGLLLSEPKWGHLTDFAADDTYPLQ